MMAIGVTVRFSSAEAVEASASARLVIAMNKDAFL